MISLRLTTGKNEEVGLHPLNVPVMKFIGKKRLVLKSFNYT